VINGIDRLLVSGRHRWKRPATPPHDLVFVIAEANRGWILDGICHDTGRHMPGNVAYHYGLDGLPPARAYFFSHYSLYLQALKRRSTYRGAKHLVYYTHPRDIGISRNRLVSALSRCTRVLSMASAHAQELVEWGVPPAQVTTVLGAADPNIFVGHERGGGGAVGLVSAYYPRKSPDRLISLVRAMPETPFVLVGRGWRDSPIAEELQTLANLEFVEVPYASYPAYYAQMDAFVSLSNLEGGPIPLIEAMMSNVFPVATRTGFAPDLIRHGVNGLLCEVDAPTETLVSLVRQALAATTEVRSTVVHLDWRRYAGCLVAALDDNS
jgi:glycosyltransferase involved in cell wall biosynthesis